MQKYKGSRPMTEEQTVQLLKKLCIPENYKFSKEDVATMLELDSLPNPVEKKRKSSAAKMGKRQIKYPIICSKDKNAKIEHEKTWSNSTEKRKEKENGRVHF